MSADFAKKHSTRPYRVACALLFLVFTFCYLYYYQNNLLAMGQHVLSNGQTHYNRMVGAIIITFVLWLMQMGLYMLTRLKGWFHILTYVPSVVCLTALTSIDSDIVHRVTLGWWWLIAPLIIVVDFVLLFYVRQLQAYEPQDFSYGILGRRAWINYSGLLALFVFVMLCSNHRQVLHARLDVEQHINTGDYSKAVKVAAHSLHTDSTLTSLRIYSLSLAGLLPDKLFEYPLVGGSAVMLPSSPNVCYLMCGQAPFYQRLGGMFRQKMSTMHYLRFIHQHHLATPVAHDYLLCAYLLDGNLESFVHAVGKYYDLKQQLPKHYREALVLYNHLRSNPYIVYHNSVMEADFADFQSLIKQYGNLNERLSAIRDTYGNTYWAYYYRMKHEKKTFL